MSCSTVPSVVAVASGRNFVVAQSGSACWTFLPLTNMMNKDETQILGLGVSFLRLDPPESWLSF